MPDYDFTEIILRTGETRPVMSKPPKLTATKKWIQQVEDATYDCSHPSGHLDHGKFADWILNAMEEFAAMNARPVFDMDGQGPQCSTCGMIWPLCGHHHLSEEAGEDDPEPAA